jgi:pimeloyl-ACP methyl ester carboxylesterase
MKEIEKLCAHGFRVFAYDHTGCMESGGADPNGMAQSLCDLNDCITTLKADTRFAGVELSVVGHSWGGFSTLNITAFHPEITHVVVMSGFVSVEMLVGSFFSGLLKGYRKAVMALERQANPRFVDCNAVQTLSSTQAQVLLIYSDDDQMCRKDPHYDALQAGLSHKENVRFLLVSGKGHNPNYTADAVKYLGQYSALQNKLTRKKQLETPEQKAEFVASFDWERMTAQDEAVWQQIFACLDTGRR